MTEIQLLLEDYIALLRVGVLPKEQMAPQRVRVNIAATLKKPPRADVLPETYNYADLMTEVEALADEHFNLLETFADRLAKNILKHPKLVAVDIRLVKLDIFDNGRVGARYRLRK